MQGKWTSIIKYSIFEQITKIENNGSEQRKEERKGKLYYATNQRSIGGCALYAIRQPNPLAPAVLHSMK